MPCHFFAVSPAEPIRFYHRTRKQLETEQVYGEKWLRWAYDTPTGRATIALFGKRALFSRWYGWRMSRPASRARIAPFVERYGVDMAECVKPAEAFLHFNDFFSRELKPQARPIDPSPQHVIFPADGRHMGWADASEVSRVFVKGQSFDLAALIGDTALAARYARGSLILSRLCPVDYHRFHFSVAGTPSAPRVISGPLYSVSPIALRRRLDFLWTNRRAITQIDSPAFGKVLQIEIGATCVGSIEQTFTPGRPVEKGAPKGTFLFGGSSTITLFEPNRICLAPDLVGQTQAGYELYALMGQTMGSALVPQ